MLQKLNLTTKVLIAAFLLFIMVLFLVAFLSFNDASVMISESEAEVETINTPMKVEKESKADAEVVDVNAPIQAEEESEVFTIVEDMPEFPGGQKELFKFIGKNIKYPPMARENGIGGTVYVGFIVAEDGSIENVQIRHGLENCSECDAEAVRVVKEMPKWNPGKQRGKPVRVAFTLPIRIKLQ